MRHARLAQAPSRSDRGSRCCRSYRCGPFCGFHGTQREEARLFGITSALRCSRCRAAEEFREPRRESLQIRGFALPYDHDAPSEFTEIACVRPVTNYVLLELVLPERRTCPGCRRPPAPFVPVPETAVDEDRLLAPGETDVRRTGKAALLKSEAVTEPVKELPYDKFRRRVRRTDTCHVRAALGRRSGFGLSGRSILPVRAGMRHTATFMAAAPSASANATGTALPIHRAMALIEPENM